jgi:hypothetical protein
VRASLAFVERVKSELWNSKSCIAKSRRSRGTFTLREQSEAYWSNLDSQNDALKPKNVIAWKKNTESSDIAWSDPSESDGYEVKFDSYRCLAGM